MKEAWKPVRDYEGLYEVSNLGRVRSIDRYDSCGRKRSGVLLSTSSYNGYKGVNLSKCGETEFKRVHSIVAEAFLTKNKYNDVVNHIDCDKSNNKVSNLEYASQKDNIIHAGLNKRLGNLKNITDEQILRILVYAYNGLSASEISAIEKINVNSVWKIASRKIILPIPKQNFEKNGILFEKKNTDRYAKKMVFLKDNGYTLKQIGYLFDLDFTTVSRYIKNYKIKYKLI